MDFSFFDIRKYRTLTVNDGYREWADNYEDTVSDLMDLRLLDQISCIPWGSIYYAADLACGTGRIGVWLHNLGINKIDGIDFTNEMLELAKIKGLYNNLILGDILDTGFESDHYDLSIEVLADEHISELTPLYKEAYRITKPGGYFVLVGFHSHFLMNGVVTHFNSSSGEPVAVKSHVHLLSDHFKAGRNSGFNLMDMNEGVVDNQWIKLKPKWEKYYMHPVSFSLVWEKQQ